MSTHEQEAEVFRALAHPTRVWIVDLLRAAGSLTVGEMQQRLGLPGANVSQHLAVLRAARLVSTRRSGTSIWYALAASGLTELLDAARRMHEAADAGRPGRPEPGSAAPPGRGTDREG